MSVRLSTGLVNELCATGSLKSILEGGAGFVIDIYSGQRPTLPDAPAAGTLLATVSSDGAGAGCHFENDAPVSGTMVKETTETWSGTVVADGTAAYYRLRRTTDNANDNSTAQRRVDGLIGTTGADLILSSLSFVTGAPVKIDAFSLTLPQT